MPPSQVRSRGGCSTCKSKHRRCDQTKPDCQQCENSGLKCSGYAFITFDPEGKTVKHYARHRSKLPARQRATPVQTRQPSRTVSANPMQEITTSVTENSFSSTGHSSEDGHEDHSFNTTTHAFDTTCAASHTSYGLTGPVNMAECYLQNTTHHKVPNDRSSYLVDQLPTAQSTMLYTSAIRRSDHSTTQHSNLILGQQFPLPLMPNCPRAASSGIDPQYSEAMHVRQLIYGSLVLDRTLESNSLSFILQSYAAWIQRTAFDPVKVARKTKDLIVKHYGNSTDSRWTIILLANLIGRLAKGRSMDEIRNPAYITIVSALREQVRSRIAHFKSYSHLGELEIQDAIMMLDNVVDTTMIFSITGHMDPELDFMREAAPIFRRACSCPDSPSKQIHLQTLFLQPTDSLRDYAVMDIFSSVITFRPMLFQYDTTFDPELGSSVLNFSDDAGMQWARGLPYQVALVFARINTLRASPAWDLGLFNELETTLQEFVPVPTVSSEPNLVIGRTIVQECWRQAAYIYLYMVCLLTFGLSVE
ncbi:unnamed protein product [Rhizoctonia solani]|uniref:Zn(2)-C6 fungal-type domain-containing protein n=1 Tax=Rhizoctonia solani TaxID=456999 RepID=A0A8H3GDP8_9AGAM|nr:unnamed protein product [Rhizoctonia solani]